MLQTKSLLLLMIISPLAASDEGTIKYQVFEETAASIKRINKDSGTLYCYFKSVFKVMGDQNQHTKPSQVLGPLSSEASGINGATKLTHMSAIQYLNLIKPRFAALDEAFMKKLADEKDVRKTWEWFDCYFWKYGLIEPLNAYELQLVKADDELIKNTRRVTQEALK